jgi:chromosome segregation ATPase
MRLDSQISKLESELQVIEKHRIDVRWTGKVRNLDSEILSIETRLMRTPRARHKLRSFQTKAASLRNEIARENRDFKEFTRSIPVESVSPRWGHQLRLRQTLTVSTSSLQERLVKVEFECVDIRRQIKNLECAVGSSRSELTGIQKSTSDLTREARKKRSLRSNITQEVRNFGKVRKRVSAVKEQIRREKIKQLNTEDDIESVQKTIDNLQRRKQHEHRKSQRLSKQLIAISAEIYANVYEPPQRHSHVKRRRDPAAGAAIDQLHSEIDCVKSRLQERRANMSRRRTPRSGGQGLSELELGLLDFMQRIGLEKERWMTNLHPSSVDLMTQSWSSQLDEVLSRSSVPRQ